jgi:alpha-L-fucosidase
MRAIIVSFLFIFSTLLTAQTLTGGGEKNPNLLTNKESLQNWLDMRFGMFIHWGPVALRGTEIGWSRGREVPIPEYDQLYKEFNPILFDADEWIRIAKSAGMKYIVLVTKHHDGFALWDSKYMNYNIMNGPFKHDIVRELADACKKQDILFGTYYSVLDWKHPDYPIELQNGKKVRRENADINKYITDMKGQLRELVEEYDTKILWFDGEWEAPWTHEMGLDLYAWGRALNDELLINNRVDKGRDGMEGVNKSAKFAGDFETPEQRIGAFNLETPWESCITICKQWAWKPNDDLKSADECIRTLLQTVGGGGNLLLNISPMLDGRIEQRQIDVLKRVGDWLANNGKAVYGTRGGPIPPQKWGVTTHKENKVFVHVFNSDKKILLPNFDQKINSATLFLTDTKVEFKKTSKGLLLSPPNTLEKFSVIELDVN